MAKYQKRPIVVEAVQWTGSNLGEILVFCPTAQHDIIDTAWEVGKGRPRTLLKIPTNEGVMIANEGDYIIRGPKNDFYPCKPDIFAMTYDRVDDSTKVDVPETKEPQQVNMRIFTKRNPVYDVAVRYDGHNVQDLRRACPDIPGENEGPVMVPVTVGQVVVRRAIRVGEWLVKEGETIRILTDEDFEKLAEPQYMAPVKGRILPD